MSRRALRISSGVSSRSVADWNRSWNKFFSTSRKMRFSARKVLRPLGPPHPASACEVLAEPVEVCRAVGTCVVPAALQRGARGG